MRAILTQSIPMLEFSEGESRYVEVDAGTYELERRPNPFNHLDPDLYACPWLYIQGAPRGMTEVSWRTWPGGVITIDETEAEAAEGWHTVKGPGRPAKVEPIAV